MIVDTTTFRQKSYRVLQKQKVVCADRKQLLYSGIRTICSAGCHPFLILFSAACEQKSRTDTRYLRPGKGCMDISQQKPEYLPPLNGGGEEVTGWRGREGKDMSEYENRQTDEIIRVQKRASNMILLDKGFLEDARISFKAKGILAYLLSRPEGEQITVQRLIRNFREGKAAIYAGLKELKECGYYEKVPVRNAEGTYIIRWESIVYEVAQEVHSGQEEEKETEICDNGLLTDFQEVENQEIENQEVENRRNEPITEEKNEKAKQSEKVPETRENSLLTGFQEIENRKVEKTAPEQKEYNIYIPDTQKNNNKNINIISQSVMSCHKNNYSQNTTLSQSVMSCQTDRTRREETERKTECQQREQWSNQSELERTRGKVRLQIGYEHLKETHSREDLRLIDELIMIILDGLLSKSRTVYLDGIEKPRELLKNSLLSLTGEDIEHVLRQFRRHGGNVRKKQKYLLSMLYHTPMEHVMAEQPETGGVCPLAGEAQTGAKQSVQNRKTALSKNRFCNFEGRQYDYDALERQLLDLENS